MWEDVAIDGSTGSGYTPHGSVNPTDMRVRFTKSYDAIIYKGFQSSNNQAFALILDRPIDGPGNGCDPSTPWQPGGGYYGRQVGP